MSPENIVIDVLAQILDLDEADLTPQTVLASIDAWDSVNGLRVLVFLERELGGVLDYDSYAAARTVQELIAVAQEAVAERAI